MSVAGDLARNRAVFAAMTGGERERLAESPGFTLPEWRGLPRTEEPPAMIFADAGEPSRTEEARVIHTLGRVPEAKPWSEAGPPPESRDEAMAEAALRYPEPAGEHGAVREDDGLVADDTYRTLLRRFDEDARQGSQLAGEEEG